MKVKRQKRMKKILSFYKSNFGFYPPYHVIIDGTFCKAALKFQVNIMEQMPKYFDCEVKLYTTSCVLQECECLGALLYGPLKVLQQYTVLDCGHQQPILATRCIQKTVTKQKHKFIAATQDQELSDALRKKTGIPLLYISHGAMTLEAPTENTRLAIDNKLQQSVAPTVKQAVTLNAMKRAVFGEDEKGTLKKRKRKGPKGPNPLSCKQKKKKDDASATSKKSRKRKGRKHKRTSANISVS